MRNIDLKQMKFLSNSNQTNKQSAAFTLQIGHCENPKLILGPDHRFCKTVLQQWK